MSSKTLSKELTSGHLIQQIQKQFPGYHPVLAIVEMAHDPQLANNPELRFHCHKTVARYVSPELKAVEVNVGSTAHRRVTVSLFDEVEVVDAEIIEDPAVAVIVADYETVGENIEDRI